MQEPNRGTEERLGKVKICQTKPILTSLTNRANQDDRLVMKTARKRGLGLTVKACLLAPLTLLGASVPNFPPNPVGERLYRNQLYREAVLPVVIVVCALLVVYFVHLFTRNHHSSN